MKKIFKNYNYISMLGAILISLISLITLFFVKDSTYFTILFIVQILMNFGITGLILLGNLDNNRKFQFIPLYLLISLMILVFEVITISNTWDLSIYSNLMYVTNIQLYTLLYSLFVIAMVLLSGYSLIQKYQKSVENNTIRQK